MNQHFMAQLQLWASSITHYFLAWLPHPTKLLVEWEHSLHKLKLSKEWPGVVTPLTGSEPSLSSIVMVFLVAAFHLSSSWRQPVALQCIWLCSTTGEVESSYKKHHKYRSQAWLDSRPWCQCCRSFFGEEEFVLRMLSLCPQLGSVCQSW